MAKILFLPPFMEPWL